MPRKTIKKLEERVHELEREVKNSERVIDEIRADAEAGAVRFREQVRDLRVQRDMMQRRTQRAVELAAQLIGVQRATPPQSQLYTTASSFIEAERAWLRWHRATAQQLAGQLFETLRLALPEQVADSYDVPVGSVESPYQNSAMARLKDAL